MKIQFIAVITLVACGSKNGSTERKLGPGSGSGSGLGPLCLTELPGPEPTGICPEWICGNTARIYGAPIEALDVRGEKAQNFKAPFKLVRGKLTDAKGDCAGVANLSLGVQNGGFVGLEGDLDKVKCSGNDLLKARFVVEQFLEPGKTRFATVRIDAIGDVAVWRRAGDEPERVPTYELVTEARPGSPIEHDQPLCGAAEWDSSIVNLPFQPKDKTRHALLLQRETYSPAATVLHEGDNWFNIGCASTAIAKLRLLGFDPMRKPEAKGDRQATLKMITGKYCGARSWTREGTVLLFVQQDKDSSGPLSPPKPHGGESAIGPIETRWGPDGALCISHSRLWSVGSKCEKENEAAFVERVRQECQIPACDEKVSCESNLASGEGVWRTCTVNHTKHESR